MSKVVNISEVSEIESSWGEEGNNPQEAALVNNAIPRLGVVRV